MDTSISVSWKGYNQVMREEFEAFLNDTSFSDCTLSAEGQIINAHRFVLSACSSLFELLFTQNTQEYPFIIISDVKFEDLKYVIEFVYRGKTQVPDYRYEEILEIGKLLHIKGLESIPTSNNSHNLETSLNLLSNLPGISISLLHEQGNQTSREQFSCPPRNSAVSLTCLTDCQLPNHSQDQILKENQCTENNETEVHESSTSDGTHSHTDSKILKVVNFKTGQGIVNVCLIKGELSKSNILNPSLDEPTNDSVTNSTLTGHVSTSEQENAVLEESPEVLYIKTSAGRVGIRVIKIEHVEEPEVIEYPIDLYDTSNLNSSFSFSDFERIFHLNTKDCGTQTDFDFQMCQPLQQMSLKELLKLSSEITILDSKGDVCDRSSLKALMNEKKILEWKKQLMEEKPKETTKFEKKSSGISTVKKQEKVSLLPSMCRDEDSNEQMLESEKVNNGMDTNILHVPTCPNEDDSQPSGSCLENPLGTGTHDAEEKNGCQSVKQSTISGQRPYQCELCGISFNRFTTLKSHHCRTLQKEYLKCNNCKKVFVTRGKLTTHERLHETLLSSRAAVSKRTRSASRTKCEEKRARLGKCERRSRSLDGHLHTNTIKTSQNEVSRHKNKEIKYRTDNLNSVTKLHHDKSIKFFSKVENATYNTRVRDGKRSRNDTKLLSQNSKHRLSKKRSLKLGKQSSSKKLKVNNVESKETNSTPVHTPRNERRNFVGSRSQNPRNCRNKTTQRSKVCAKQTSQKCVQNEESRCNESSHVEEADNSEGLRNDIKSTTKIGVQNIYGSPNKSCAPQHTSLESSSSNCIESKSKLEETSSEEFKRFHSNKSTPSSTSSPKLDEGNSKRHTSTKFNCSSCGTKFMDSFTLLAHSLLHSREAPSFTCDTCKERFTQRSRLARHIRYVHKGKRRHRCVRCGESFAHLTALLAHRGTAAGSCRVVDKRKSIPESRVQKVFSTTPSRVLTPNQAECSSHVQATARSDNPEVQTHTMTSEKKSGLSPSFLDSNGKDCTVESLVSVSDKRDSVATSSIKVVQKIPSFKTSVPGVENFSSDTPSSSTTIYNENLEAQSISSIAGKRLKYKKTSHSSKTKPKTPRKNPVSKLLMENSDIQSSTSIAKQSDVKAPLKVKNKTIYLGRHKPASVPENKVQYVTFNNGTNGISDVPTATPDKQQSPQTPTNAFILNHDESIIQQKGSPVCPPPCAERSLCSVVPSTTTIEQNVNGENSSIESVLISSSQSESDVVTPSRNKRTNDSPSEIITEENILLVPPSTANTENSLCSEKRSRTIDQNENCRKQSFDTVRESVVSTFTSSTHKVDQKSLTDTPNDESSFCAGRNEDINQSSMSRVSHESNSIKQNDHENTSPERVNRSFMPENHANVRKSFISPVSTNESSSLLNSNNSSAVSTPQSSSSTNRNEELNSSSSSSGDLCSPIVAYSGISPFPMFTSKILPSNGSSEDVRWTSSSLEGASRMASSTATRVRGAQSRSLSSARSSTPPPPLAKLIIELGLHRSPSFIQNLIANFVSMALTPGSPPAFRASKIRCICETKPSCGPCTKVYFFMGAYELVRCRNCGGHRHNIPK